MDASEVERMAAALERWGITTDRQWSKDCAEAAQLLRSLAKDASRYQWLRGQYRLMSPHMDGNHDWAPKMAAILKGNTMDAAIDSAMARKEGGG